MSKERAPRPDGTTAAEKAKYERWRKIWNGFAMVGFGAAAVGTLLFLNGALIPVAVADFLLYGGATAGGLGLFGRTVQGISRRI